MFEDMRGASDYESDEWNLPEPKFTISQISKMDILHLLEVMYEWN